MSFSIRATCVSRGIAIGRAVVVSGSHLNVAHFYIEPHEIQAHVHMIEQSREAVIADLVRLQKSIVDLPDTEVPPDLAAVIDVHLMLLGDESVVQGISFWIEQRRYNAQWALTAYAEQMIRQFDEMQDEYLRERKSDVQQVIERILRHVQGKGHSVIPKGMATSLNVTDQAASSTAGIDLKMHQLSLLDDQQDCPLVLIAHDLSPADMLQFKKSAFAGFVTDVGGKTSHTAIVARSLNIPALVGARSASHLITQDDVVIIDAQAGEIIVNPSTIILEEYSFKKRQDELERTRLLRLRDTPCITLDGERVELLANIELPEDCDHAIASGAVGIGLFRSEFLFMGRQGNLPDEQEQYEAYKKVVQSMQGLPVTIRTIDIGADKPLDNIEPTQKSFKETSHLNPALGLRAIRWSLAEPSMFLIQLRALLRVAALGKVNILVPMLGSVFEIKQTLEFIKQAKQQLSDAGIVYADAAIGAMIEVPAAALQVPVFLKYFDFLSIGTNDLIQYTLAIDRADERVSHLYDPMHPAILALIAKTIAHAKEANKPVSLCGEMAGDMSYTPLLLGLGLRSFSMDAAHMLQVKQAVLRFDTQALQEKTMKLLQQEEPTLAHLL